MSGKNKQKIALLGGTFDPAHFGHLGISKEALKIPDIKQVWWLPTKQNPLKKHKSSDFLDRFNFCQEISKNEPNIIVKDYENDLKSCYFIDLLSYIFKKNPLERFCLILGSDNMKNFHLWHKYQEIIDLVEIFVFKREPYDDEVLNSEIYRYCQNLSKERGKKYLTLIDSQKYDISATKIREENDKNSN